MKLVVSIAALCAAYPLVLSAQTERDLDAHVHGQAAANIAVFDSNVVIDIESPWNNLVGFEYAAKSDEEIAAVTEAVAMLNQPESVIGLIGGNCKADQVTVESSLSDDDHDDDEHDDEHHDDEHDDEHHDEHHDDEHAEHDDDHHDDEHADHDEHEESTHSSVTASYSFVCENIDELTAVDMKLFKIWDGFAELDVQVVGEQGSTFVELNPGSTVVELADVK